MAAVVPDVGWLATFARDLRRTDDYQGLIELVRRGLGARFGLTNAWLYVFEREDDQEATLVAAAGPKTADIRFELPVAPMAGDWLVTALRRDEVPIVIPDARGMAGNPDVARRLDNRSVVNIPIGMVDRTLGILGGGTFGNEGPVEIDDRAIPELLHLGHLASMAIARLVLRSRDEARERLQAQLAQHQRIEGLGQLAAGVAHDFHNLLNVIRASVGFIAAGPLTDAQRDDLKVIAEAERSASELTGKLLLLGRQKTPTFVATDVNEITNRCLRLLERAIPASIQTTFTPAPGLPAVRVDPHQFEQVLLNLALNARDALPADGRLAITTAVVTLDENDQRAHAWAKPGRYVRIAVADTGRGMPPEVVERMYEPFFTTKPQGQGTGLGLAVVWSVVQQHGGLIHCRSDVGGGTTFEIYLPVAEAGVPDAPPIVVPGAPGGTERILLADDHPLLLPITARVLAGAGYDVLAVENGAQAVEAAAKEEFALHILDAVMPVMSGRQACEGIRALRPAARILFTSGYRAGVLPAEFLSGAGIQVVPKPFDAQTLLRTVRDTLDAAPGDGPPRQRQ